MYNTGVGVERRRPKIGLLHLHWLKTSWACVDFPCIEHMYKGVASLLIGVGRYGQPNVDVQLCPRHML